MIDLRASQDFVILGDNAQVLATLSDASFQLIYIDPPFNTGSVQQRKTLHTVRDKSGDRTGVGNTPRTLSSQPPCHCAT
jgi:site-specific DNA-methyltransferase (adenine-specific)